MDFGLSSGHIRKVKSKNYCYGILHSSVFGTQCVHRLAATIGGPLDTSTPSLGPGRGAPALGSLWEERCWRPAGEAPGLLALGSGRRAQQACAESRLPDTRLVGPRRRKSPAALGLLCPLPAAAPDNVWPQVQTYRFLRVFSKPLDTHLAKTQLSKSEDQTGRILFTDSGAEGTLLSFRKGKASKGRASAKEGIWPGKSTSQAGGPRRGWRGCQTWGGGPESAPGLKLQSVRP